MKKTIILVTSLMLLVSCASGYTAISKRKLDVKTKMSESIFLDPLPVNKQIAYVKIRNTSGDRSLNIEEQVKSAIAAKGYKITNDPAKANVILQANVLQAGKLDNADSKTTAIADAIVPGVLGGVIGRSADRDSGTVVGAIAGASLGMAGGAFIKDVTYSIITDLQLSQKTGSPARTRKYNTRVMSYANKVNLKYEDAKPILVDELVESIAGVL